MIALNAFAEVDSSFRLISPEKISHTISTMCSLDHFERDGIIFIKNKKYYNRLKDKLKTEGDARNIGIIFQNTFLAELAINDEKAFLNQFAFYAVVDSVDLALSRFSKLFYDQFEKKADDIIDGRQTETAQVHATATIAEGVFLGKGVTVCADVVIHSGCVILSHSTIGENTVLYPNVVIYRNVRIGKNCRIHANTTIGSDGYGYNYFKGEHLKVWHFGGVNIADSVEIGSGTSIDQGTFSPTLIGEGTKIDNQVHLSHNCKIGKGVLITGQAGFGGSVTLGDYVAMGGCAVFAPEVVVGKYAQIGGMSAVTSDVPEREIYAGHPARPLKEWLKSIATLRRLALKSKVDNKDFNKIANDKEK
jgi:UDP-3-O-[3-hydroxymyristoyl] glucosamine N-acyltransferase